MRVRGTGKGPGKRPFYNLLRMLVSGATGCITVEQERLFPIGRACSSAAGCDQGSGLLALLLGLIVGGGMGEAAVELPVPAALSLPVLAALLAAAPADHRAPFTPVLTSGGPLCTAHGLCMSHMGSTVTLVIEVPVMTLPSPKSPCLH